jgi:sugar lactone lactonase YvrE
MNRAQKSTSVDDKTLIAESAAYNPETRTYYIGSVHQRKIVAIDKNGTQTDFSKASDGLWSVLGVRVDAKRGFLWACTTAFPQMKGFETADKGRSGVFKYDLATGKLIRKYLLPTGEDHALGDLILDRDGNVYATDSKAPAIYRIAVKSDSIEEFLRSRNFSSLQGLAFDHSGAELFVADYSKGIFRVNLASKEITQQKPASDITLLGIDGLYFHRGSLIAIQNGVTPNRVLRLNVDKDRISTQEILEANHPDFDEPTLGVLIDDDLHFIANSQWGNVNEKAELVMDKLRPPVVLKINLKK